MDSLVKLDGILTMSSVEIAELTGKEHKNVLADIREMLKNLNLRLADFSADYKDAGNRTYQCFNLPKREALILVSGYSVAMRAKIIDRWQELEKQTITLPNFLDPAESAIAWANEYRAKRLAFATIEQQKPAVEFVDRFVNIKSSKSITEVAKILGVGQREFFDWLAEKKIIYKRSDNWLPASTYAKYFDVKIKQVSETKEVSQSRFVPAGIVWIATKWTKEKTQLSLGL